MPSITFWNRLEPRPRSRDVAEPLAARLRDPLWMLTRQWQFGEFRGEDAGSPAFVSLSGNESRIVSWRDREGTTHAVDSGAPLEKTILREPLRGDDLSLQVELGQRFERLLRRFGSAAAIAAFRAPDAFLLRRPDEATLAATRDQQTARFLRVAGGRAIDGVALWRAAAASSSAVLEQVGLDSAAVKTALETFVAVVLAVYGDLRDVDPPNWRPERLEYSAAVGSSAGAAPMYEVHAARDAELDWHSFDRVGSAPAEATPFSFSVIPTHVRFRGMPNARYWDFESRVTDFGAIRASRADLAKLLVMDFMLVHGNDWFVVPYPQAIGAIVEVDAIVVTDVFGGKTFVPRADAGQAATRRQRWSMFSLTDATGGIAPVLLMPPGPGAALQVGAPVEEVRFGRDEMANMVWAVERLTENALGHPEPAAERRAGTAVTPPPAPDPNAPPLRYRLQSDVPEHWIPFIPVAIDANGQIALERAALLQFDDAGRPIPRVAVARVLRPSLPAGTRYRIREEEITRGGTRVRRHYFRTRWSDGSTHLWLARTKSLHALEEDSGLRYDIAEEQR